MEEKNIFDKIKEYRKKRKEKAAKNKPQTFNEIALAWIKTFGVALASVMLLHNLLFASMIVPTGSMENTVLTGDFLIVNRKFGPSTPQMIPIVEIPLPHIMFPSISEPKRGDVIVFVYQGDRDMLKPQEFQYYLKRCVAEPGDTLQIIESKLYVNGKHQPLATEGIELNREDISDVFRTFPKSKKYTNRNYGPIRIPQKGDTIYFHTRDDFEDFRVFIEREGYKANWLGENELTLGKRVLIDNKATNFYIVEQDYYFGMGDNRGNSSDSREWGFIPRKAILGSPMFCWLSWEMYDEYGQERSIIGKFANIRWNRIGRLIN